MRQQQSRILEPLLVAFLMLSVVGVLGGTLGGCGYDGAGAGILISDIPGGTTTDVPDPTPVPDPDPSITDIQPISTFAGDDVLVSGSNWRSGDIIRFAGGPGTTYTTGTAGVANVIDYPITLNEDCYSGSVAIIRTTATFTYGLYDIVPVVNTVTGTITNAAGGTLTIGGTGFNWTDATVHTVTIYDGTPATATPSTVTSVAAADNTLDVTFGAGAVAAGGPYDVTVTIGGLESAVTLGSVITVP